MKEAFRNEEGAIDLSSIMVGIIVIGLIGGVIAATQAGWMKTMMKQTHNDGALFVNMFNTQKESDWRLNSTTEGAGVLTTVKSDSAFKAGAENSGGYIKAALKK